MTVNNNFTFEIAYGKETVQDKENFDWRTVHYYNKTTTVDELASMVKEGHPFNSLMKGMEQYEAKHKRKDNFESSSVLSFDFDDCPDCFNQAYEETTLTPTLAYTTPSDGIKGNRFRFVYVFSKPITSTDEYTELYYTIAKKLGLPITSLDDNLKSGVQNIGGMQPDRNGQIKVSNIIYNKEDFLLFNNVLKDNIPSSNTKRYYDKSANKNNKREKRENGIILNCTFKEDLDNLDFRQFLNKYRTVYQYFDMSNLDFKNGYAIIPDDYYQIIRKWHKETIDTKNGEKEISVITKLKDGQERRNKLFVQCLIRRKIKPDVTLEELVYNLACERQFFFNNEDGQLSNKELIRIATNAMDVEEITIKPTKISKKFVVDKEYWAERGLNANQAKQLIKKMLKSEEIGNLYDPELTDKQNIELFKQYNVKCSIRTLKNWKKENGLTREYNKK